jgi:RNA polymerase sigma-32 factor
MTMAARQRSRQASRFAPRVRERWRSATSPGPARLRTDPETTSRHARRSDPEEPPGPVDNRTLSTYLRDIRRYEVLSRREEHAIATRFVETADRELAAQLVRANLRLVVKLAREYPASRRNLADLVQEGNLGLVHAVEKYDPHRGIKLSTYAAWWIRAYMLKFILANARLVKLGTTRAQRKLFFGMGRTRARLEAKAGSEVESRELAAALSVPEPAVVEMQRRLSSSDASLDGPAYSDDDRTRMGALDADVTRADRELEDAETRRLVRREMHAFACNLIGRDRVIFHRRLLCQEPQTLRTIAATFGVTRERVRQLEVDLKARLRHHLEERLGDAIPDLGC